MITSGSRAGLQKLRQLTELHRKQAAGQSTLHASSLPFRFILQAVASGAAGGVGGREGEGVEGGEDGKGSEPEEEPMLDLCVGVWVPDRQVSSSLHFITVCTSQLG